MTVTRSRIIPDNYEITVCHNVIGAVKNINAKINVNASLCICVGVCVNVCGCVHNYPENLH